MGWLWYPGLPPVLVSIAFTFAFHNSVFFHSLFFTCHWISFVFILYGQRCRSFTYSLFMRFSRLGTGFGTRCCGLRGGTGVCMMEQNLDPNFCPDRVEPQTFASSGRQRCH